MDQLTKEQAIEILEKEYPNGVDLVYVDYRDDIQDPKTMQKILIGDHEELYDQDRMNDAQHESINEIITKHFNDKYDELSDEVTEAIRDRCREHDTSNPMKDLIKHTSDPLVAYDTGFYFEDTDNGDEMEEQCVECCKTLGIELSYVPTLFNIRRDASYGGNLVFLFNADLQEFYELGDRAPTTDKYLIFNQPMVVGIIHYGNGSGWYHTVKLTDKQSICVPLDAKRLEIDSLEKYGVQRIFGCDRDIGAEYEIKTGWRVWDTGESADPDIEHHYWLSIPRIPYTTVTETEARLKQEAEYIKTYQAGGCTAGDKDINRHRNTKYVNEFPCGTHCFSCGHFRID